MNLVHISYVSAVNLPLTTIPRGNRALFAWAEILFCALASLLMPYSVLPACMEINGELKCSCLHQASHRQGVAKFSARCHLVSHSTQRWLSWTNSVPMRGKSSSTGIWSHRRLCWWGSPEREVREQGHSPTFVSPMSSHKQQPGKARQVPKDPSKRKAGLKKG